MSENATVAVGRGSPAPTFRERSTFGQGALQNRRWLSRPCPKTLQSRKNGGSPVPRRVVWPLRGVWRSGLRGAPVVRRTRRPAHDARACACVPCAFVPRMTRVCVPGAGLGHLSPLVSESYAHRVPFDASCRAITRRTYALLRISRRQRHASPRRTRTPHRRVRAPGAGRRGMASARLSGRLPGRRVPAHPLRGHPARARAWPRLLDPRREPLAGGAPRRARRASGAGLGRALARVLARHGARLPVPGERSRAARAQHLLPGLHGGLRRSRTRALPHGPRPRGLRPRGGLLLRRGALHLPRRARGCGRPAVASRGGAEAASPGHRRLAGAAPRALRRRLRPDSRASPLLLGGAHRLPRRGLLPAHSRVV